MTAYQDALTNSSISGVEYLSPPYLTKTRPTLSGIPATIAYGATFTVTVTAPANSTSNQSQSDTIVSRSDTD
jgi:hypothetical protein